MLFVIILTVAVIISVGIGFLFVDYGQKFSWGSLVMGLLTTGFLSAMVIGVVHGESTPSGYAEVGRQKVNSVVYLASDSDYLIDVDLGGGVSETIRTKDVVVSEGGEKDLIHAKGYHDAWHVLPWASGSYKTQMTLVVPSEMIKVVVK